jgi:predicted dehydrogenase
MRQLRVGLIGLGAIGRVHFECWQKSPHAQLVAISSRNSRLLAGDWSSQAFNLGDQAAQTMDLSALARYASAEELIADPRIEAVDICLPTPLHAPIAIAALRAGKHVFCEKPMALSVEDCVRMERAAEESGRRLLIGHCLRYWPHYVKAHEVLTSEEFGPVRAASFHRSSAAPAWSGGSWHLDAAQSGGVLDLHIHDIDVALWWFGAPQSVTASGVVEQRLPLRVDAIWRYPDDITVRLHGGWQGGPFRHAFQVVMEKATLTHDLAIYPHALLLEREGRREIIPVAEASAYQRQLDDFAAALNVSHACQRCPLADSRRAVELGLEELRQLGA